MLRENGKDLIIAQEKGYNTYVKVDDSKCKAAQDWWKKNSDKWSRVRSKWDEVYGRNMTLKLESKVDNKVLYKHLFSDKVSSKDEINGVIDAFVKK